MLIILKCHLTYNNKTGDDHVKEKEKRSSANLYFVRDVRVRLLTAHVFDNISLAGNSNQVPLAILHKLLTLGLICFLS